MWSVVLTVLLTAPTIQLSAENFTSLNPNSAHLIDPTQKLGVSAVYEEFLNNDIPPASTLSLGFDDAAHWFVTKVENSSPETAWILELEYPLLDYVNVYVVRSRGDIEHSAIGDRYDFSERYFPSRFLHLPLGLEQNETVTLLWRISTQTSIIALSLIHI